MTDTITIPLATVQEPTPWRDMIVVTLVREGINKHKARELADHFAAQPVQKPVACRFCHSKKGCRAWQCYKCGEIDDVQQPAPLPAPPVQEPAAWMRPSEEGYDSAFRAHSTVVVCTGNPWTGWIPLYTTPPAAQRPWVGLTEQDMPSGKNPMFDHQYFTAGMVYAAKVLQAKNT
jgi:hypothetical protein